MTSHVTSNALREQDSARAVTFTSKLYFRFHGIDDMTVDMKRVSIHIRKGKIIINGASEVIANVPGTAFIIEQQSTPIFLKTGVSPKFNYNPGQSPITFEFGESLFVIDPEAVVHIWSPEIRLQWVSGMIFGIRAPEPRPVIDSESKVT